VVDAGKTALPNGITQGGQTGHLWQWGGDLDSVMAREFTVARQC
jgi:hypothetical protein